MKVPEFLKPLLALFAIGAITQSGGAQARNLRAQIEDGKVSTGIPQEIEAPTEFGVVAQRELQLAAENNPNATMDIAELFAAVKPLDPEWFTISNDKEQTEKELEVIGNRIMPTSAEQSSLEDRRELVFIDVDLICFNHRFLPSVKDTLQANSQIVFRPAEITTNGVKRYVDPAKACLAITLPLENGKYFTTTVGKLADKDAAAGISSFHVDAENMLKISNYVEIKLYDSYDDPTKGKVENVVQVNVYTFASYPYGYTLSKSVFIELPDPIMKDGYSKRFLTYPWSLNEALPGARFTRDGAPIATIAPKTDSPTPRPTVPTSKPTPQTYPTYATKSPTTKPTTKPSKQPTVSATTGSTASPTTEPKTYQPTTDKNDPKTNFPTSAPTAGVSSSPTGSAVNTTAATNTTLGGGSQGSANPQAAAGGDDTAGKAVGAIFGIGAVTAAAVALNKKYSKAVQENAPTEDLQTTKGQNVLPKPVTRDATRAPFSATPSETPKRGIVDERVKEINARNKEINAKNKKGLT